jgi:FAD/FMN-containing dehydrogenase
MLQPPSEAMLAGLEELLGPRGFNRLPAAMEPWLTDWRGRYRGKAAALLSPASSDEVQAIVRRCADAKVAIVPQGGNTSMVGGATPDGGGGALLLSLRRMRRIRGLWADDNMVVAEAGVILSDLHDAAAGIGRRFPLSLGAKGSATIGGLVSTNAGGTQVLRFGPMRSLAVGVEAVLPDGSLHRGLSSLRKDNRGYDLSQLLIGAEGTLGVVTAASLRLVPAVGSRSVAWVGLGSPEDALALLRRLEERLGGAVESFELVPGDALALVLRHIPGTRPPLASDHSWHVLVEATAPPGAPEPPLADALLEAGVRHAAVASSEAQEGHFWRLRDSISEAERHEGPSLKHDISVPVSAMPAFVVAARADVEGRFPGCSVIAFGHLGDGNVHFNVRPPPSSDGAAWIEGPGIEVTEFVHDLVTDAGGSISAEHGIGQMKRLELARTSDPARLAVQRALKAALDPLGIMNPGKLLP